MNKLYRVLLSTFYLTLVSCMAIAQNTSSVKAVNDYASTCSGVSIKYDVQKNDVCSEAPNNYCVSTNSCMTYFYYQPVYNGTGKVFLRYKITNNCNNDLSNVAFSLPSGKTAISPQSQTYSFNVENPAGNPFYSVKFQINGSPGYKNGASDYFSYYLDSAAFSTMTVVNVTAKAASNSYPVSFPAAGCGTNYCLDRLSISVVSGPKHGSYTVLSDGSIRYTPQANFSGLDSIRYRACNTEGKCDYAYLYINVCRGNNTITGIVFYDQNQDGLFQDNIDALQPAIRIALIHDVNGNGVYDAGIDAYVDTVMTGGKGFYSFTVGRGHFITRMLFDMPASNNYTTVQTQTAYFNTDGNTDPNNDFGFGGESVGCFAFARQDMQLYSFNRITGESDTIGTINNAPFIRSMDLAPDNSTLYVLNAENPNGRLGTLDMINSTYGPLPYPVGAVNGVNGIMTTDSITGISFDINRGTVLYAVIGRVTATYLVQINAGTGKAIKNAFGIGKDYLPLDISVAANKAAKGTANKTTATGRTMDDIAFDPITAEMYGIVQDENTGTNGMLVKIDPVTGTVTPVGPMLIDDVEGLTFAREGVFVGTTGDNGTPANSFVEIDKNTGKATLIKNFSYTGQDFEACACVSREPVPMLPVELLSFSVRAQGNSALVQWQTASETNSAFFSIERSTDGRDFNEVAQVRAAGNTDFILNYSYSDEDLAPGTYYFRLRQEDINGDFEYFEMKKVSIGEIESILRIFPVPASQGQEVTLEGVRSGETLLQIISLQGQVLAREIKSVESTGVLKISTTNMLPGTYLIKVGNEATRLIIR